VSFILEFAHQLSNNFCISLASKIHLRKVFVFDFGMIVNNTIVNKKYFLILVVVRMTVSFIYLTTSCPSGMSNSNSWTDRFFCEFIDKSLNAIKTWLTISLFRKLAHHFSDLIVLFSEWNNAGTIIASIFEQLYTVAEKSLNRRYGRFFGIEILFRFDIGAVWNDTKNTAALRLFGLFIVEGGCDEAAEKNFL